MTDPKLIKAAERLLKIKEASESYPGFIRAAFPGFRLTRFQEELVETFDALHKRTLGAHNLLITMPPRHGKSTYGTQSFAAYTMLSRPDTKMLSVSYGADLASRFGRIVRDMTMDPIMAQAFPSYGLNPTSTAVDDWGTTDGGCYYACGLGGGTTGRPANALIIDDPIKNQSEADSPASRNKVWSYYNGSLVNRKEPYLDGTLPIEVLIQTRWHPDDLGGRIMESDDWHDGLWHHLNFPAISEKRSTQVILPRNLLPKDDPLYLSEPQVQALPIEERSAGELKEEPLWPERYPLDFLHRMRRRDPRSFAALYQQTPYVAGGNLIRTTWFNFYDKGMIPDRFHTLIIAADTASKTKTMSDYTVLMVLGLTHSGDIYILDVVRERLDYPTLRRRLISENSRWRGKGLRGIYIEDRSSGTQVLQDLRREPGISVIPYLYKGGRDASDKVSRVNSVLPLIEGGRVFLPDNADWMDNFIDEAQSFPASKYDDQIDCLAIGLDVLSRIGLSMSTDMPDISSSLNSLSSFSNLFQGQKLGSALMKPLGEL